MDIPTLPARGRRPCYAAEPSDSTPLNPQPEGQAINVLPASWDSSESQTEAGSTAGYRYMEHPSDVGIHAWGESLQVAFREAGYALFGYMTDLSKIDPVEYHNVTLDKKEGSSLESLFYDYLNELLYLYGSDYFVPSKIKIECLDETRGRLTASLWGEKFDYFKHSQGTEVKAITYHGIQVISPDARHPIAEVKVLLDI